MPYTTVVLYDIIITISGEELDYDKVIVDIENLDKDRSKHPDGGYQCRIRSADIHDGAEFTISKQAFIRQTILYKLRQSS